MIQHPSACGLCLLPLKRKTVIVQGAPVWVLRVHWPLLKGLIKRLA